MQEIRRALSVENLKTLMKLGGSAFYFPHALVILNKVGDKMLLKRSFVGLTSK